jgi:hypothetical protein
MQNRVNVYVHCLQAHLQSSDKWMTCTQNTDELYVATSCITIMGCFASYAGLDKMGHARKYMNVAIVASSRAAGITYTLPAVREAVTNAADVDAQICGYHGSMLA